MFETIKKLFFKPKRSEAELIEELLNTPDSGLLDDEDFGLIEYFQPDNQDGIWQMSSQWEYSKHQNNLLFCSTAIVGNIKGPHQESRRFLLSKNSVESLNVIWQKCDIQLRELLPKYCPEFNNNSPKEVLNITNISIEKLENGQVVEWEATFEPRNKNHNNWVWVHAIFRGEELVGCSIDT